MGLSGGSLNKSADGEIYINGGTDGTLIGNDSDRLKTTATITGTSSITDVTSPYYFTDHNQFYSAATRVNMATRDTTNALIYFRNPTGSGKKCFIWKIDCGCTVTNVAAEWSLYINPTVSNNGTTLTPQVRNLNNSQSAAVALVTTLPTVSAFGTLIETSISGQNTVSGSLVDSSFGLCLQANSNMLIVGNPSSNNRSASITIFWAEV